MKQKLNNLTDFLKKGNYALMTPQDKSVLNYKTAMGQVNLTLVI